jgi:hypothetical protein
MPQGPSDVPLVENMFSGVFHANLGIANFMVVGLQLPVHLVTGPGTAGDGSIAPLAGHTPTDNGLNYQGFGSLTVHAKFRFLRAERTNFGLGLVVQAGIPLDTAPSNYASDPGFMLWPSVVAEWRPHRVFRMDLNVGYRMGFGSAGRIVDTTWANPLTYGLGLSVRVASALDLVAEVYGGTYTNNFFQPRSTPMVRAFIGFIFEPSIGDRDGDGYRDDVDRCPDEPEDFDNFEDEDGCPEPDNDRDGILDVDDQCPLVPEDRNGEQTRTAAPTGTTWRPRRRRHPRQRRPVPRRPRRPRRLRGRGRLPRPRQRPGRHPRHATTSAPTTPRTATASRTTTAAPTPTTTTTASPTCATAAPTSPRPTTAPRTRTAAPTRASPSLEENNIRILQAINFETDSAQIRPESLPIVEAVAATLRGNPQISAHAGAGPRRRARRRRPQPPAHPRPRGERRPRPSSSAASSATGSRARATASAARPAHADGAHQRARRLRGGARPDSRGEREQGVILRGGVFMLPRPTMDADALEDISARWLTSLAHDFKDFLHVVADDLDLDDGLRERVVTAVLYTLAPGDVVPDTMGAIGYLDDALGLRVALDTVREEAPGRFESYRDRIPDLVASVEDGDLAAWREALGDVYEPFRR